MSLHGATLLGWRPDQLIPTGECDARRRYPPGLDTEPPAVRNVDAARASAGAGCLHGNRDTFAAAQRAMRKRSKGHARVMRSRMVLGRFG
jgi:hypothetical protein